MLKRPALVLCAWHATRGNFPLIALAVFHSMIAARAAVDIRKEAYHGWNEALIISNGKVEAVVVPAIGRIMQFRFAGQNDGPFWENRALEGKNPDSHSSEWINFGGDKAWPAPQSDWAKVTGHAWPPPSTFDSGPVTASVTNRTIVLTSAADPSYGILVERRISLLSNQAEMAIETTFRKVSGDPVRTSVWVVTQLQEPERLYMPLPFPSIFGDGYNKQSEILPSNLKVEDNIVTCTRSAKDSTKIGSDSSWLFWGNEKYILQISSRRGKRSEYPDHGSSAEIYTNPDPQKYIEFEFLGALATMNKGNSISRTQFYKLYARDRRPLDEQVHALIASNPDWTRKKDR